MKQRIDVYLTANGLADSREKAQALIRDTREKLKQEEQKAREEKIKKS